MTARRDRPPLPETIDGRERLQTALAILIYPSVEYRSRKDEMEPKACLLWTEFFSSRSKRWKWVSCAAYATFGASTGRSVTENWRRFTGKS